MITYIEGDATRPVGDGPKYIVHIVNDIGAWGAGFVMAISKRWRHVKKDYQREKGSLGKIQIVQVEPDIFVVNLWGQKGIHRKNDNPPIRYDAIRKGLEKLVEEIEGPASIHMPRIGCGLAGGKWSMIEPIIQETLVAAGIPVTVYDWH